jgi:hypothetical protein
MPQMGDRSLAPAETPASHFPVELRMPPDKSAIVATRPDALDHLSPERGVERANQGRPLHNQVSSYGRSKLVDATTTSFLPIVWKASIT